MFLVTSKTVEKQWLATRLRHDDRLTALHDAADNAFADAISDAVSRLLIKTVASFDTNFRAFAIEEHYKAPDHAVVTAECFQRGSESCLEVVVLSEDAAGFEESVEFLNFATLARDQFRSFCVMAVASAQHGAC